MGTPLFNKYGNINNQQPQNFGGNNILAQFAMVKKNPGIVLDILLRNQKINQQQYNDLQQYKNDPEMIARYLMNNGKASEIRQAEQMMNQKI